MNATYELQDARGVVISEHDTYEAAVEAAEEWV
jgi:hypothetical protein